MIRNKSVSRKPHGNDSHLAHRQRLEGAPFLASEGVDASCAEVCRITREFHPDIGASEIGVEKTA